MESLLTWGNLSSKFIATDLTALARFLIIPGGLLVSRVAATHVRGLYSRAVEVARGYGNAKE